MTPTKGEKMLAQAAATSAVAALAITVAALLAATGPIALFCTKVTDATRNWLDANDTWPKVVWNVEPLILGVLFCLGFKLNAADAVAKAIPALVGTNAVAGAMGEVLTGLFAGAAAGFWHDKLASYSGKRGGADSMHPAGPPEPSGP